MDKFFRKQLSTLFTKQRSMKIFLNGYKGRMGQAISNALAVHNVELAGKADAGETDFSLLKDADVLIDYSHHSVTLGVVERAAVLGKAVVIGTTGHSEEERSAIIEFAKKIPIVWAGNYSVGVNLLFYLTEKAAQILDKSFQAEIIEMHHNLKVDAPSGTAMDLVRTIEKVRGLDSSCERHGRVGQVGARTEDEIGIHAVRGGSIVGEHTVLFINPNERIELTHRASDRGIFANGTLRAAKWVAGKPAGLYSMRDVLGLL